MIKIFRDNKGQIGLGVILILIGIFVSILMVTIFVPLWEEKIDEAYWTDVTDHSLGHTNSDGITLLFDFKAVYGILAAIIPLGAFGFAGAKAIIG